MPIPVIISQYRKHSKVNKGANLANCVRIKRDGPPSTVKVPKLMLTNVRPLAPKMDEVSHFMLHNHIDIAFITETWLRESIPDSVVYIPGYTVFR